MILVDTSVWVQHLRHGEPTLAQRLDAREILTHPLILGELAMGNLAGRDRFLTELRRLPKAIAATDEEVLDLVDRERLFGLGVGYVDACLLAATRLTPDAHLWTFDRRLAETAMRLGLSGPAIRPRLN